MIMDTMVAIRRWLNDDDAMELMAMLGMWIYRLFTCRVFF